MVQSYGRALAAPDPARVIAAVTTIGSPSEITIRLTDNPSFIRFLAARLAGGFAMQIQVVAVGWQMYDLTGDPLDLGLVGLVQFAPSLALLFVTGSIIDRFDRRLVIIVARTLEAVASASLAVGAVSGGLTPGWIFAAVFVLGSARAFDQPASQALVPRLVPPEMLSRAIATSSSTLQVAMIAGPALGGLIYLAGSGIVYACSALLFLLGAVLMVWVEEPRSKAPLPPFSLTYLFAGLRFIRSQPVLLGAISLDMVAVLLGGATALLPIYARDILHTGPEGLGALRSAPAIGAIVTAIWLARRPLQHRVGRKMLVAVACFGAAMLVFAFSTSVALSVLALSVTGAADMFSVVIRQSLVQLETPDEMRGRVSAVNTVFIGASNQIGEFESGVTAAWLGPVGSVVLGGIGTLVVVAIWATQFPALRRRDSLLPTPRVPAESDPLPGNPSPGS
jgi:MFS family permease